MASEIATLHRIDDDESSIAGAEHIADRVGSIRAQFLIALADEELTAREVASRITSDACRSDSLRRRATDLMRDGLIEIAGRRPCKISGVTVATYKRKNPDDVGASNGVQNSISTNSKESSIQHVQYSV